MFFLVHPRRLPWNLKIDLWKTIFLYNPLVFRFHVNLPGCTSLFNLSIASRLAAIASRLEAIASRLETIAIRLEAIASRLEAIAVRLEAIAIRFFYVALPGTSVFTFPCQAERPDLYLSKFMHLSHPQTWCPLDLPQGAAFAGQCSTCDGVDMILDNPNDQTTSCHDSALSHLWQAFNPIFVHPT